MKAQLAIEYTLTVLIWIVICTLISYLISPYVAAISYEHSTAAYTSTLQEICEIADSDLDGMKYLHDYYYVNQNLTFNNTVARMHMTGSEILVNSLANYTYADEFRQGDALLIKNNDGKILAIKVS